MKKVLLSAFACDPSKGSELSNGWYWATGLAKEGYEIFCFTRAINKPGIELFSKPAHVNFYFISLPFKLEKLYSFSTPGMYLYYIMWQWLVYKKARKLSVKHKFFRAHHVTWGSMQMGSFLYKLKVPFIFGPSGGGQIAPHNFKKYFLQYWSSELKREKVSDLLQKHNPAFKNMVVKAHAVIASNNETVQLLQDAHANNIHLSLDAALPENFSPTSFSPKKTKEGKLTLLWTGRFMARKGLLLIIDVMNKLKYIEGITLTVVGDGEMKDAVINKINEYNLHNTVKLTGKVPFSEVKNYYASHDIFFYTSLRDSCPAQLIEAMSFGMPVVTLNLHGQSMIVSDETGIRCACSTPETAINELANAITYLFSHPEEVSKMSSAAYNFAKEQTWEKKIKQITSDFYKADN